MITDTIYYNNHTFDVSKNISHQQENYDLYINIPSIFGHINSLYLLFDQYKHK